MSFPRAQDLTIRRVEKSCFLRREANHWHAVEALRAEKTQLEVQLATTRLVAAAAQAGGAEEKAALEARVKLVEDRAAMAQSAAEASCRRPPLR